MSLVQFLDYCPACPNLTSTLCNQLFIDFWELFLQVAVFHNERMFILLCKLTLMWMCSLSYCPGSWEFSAGLSGRVGEPGLQGVWEVWGIDPSRGRGHFVSLWVGISWSSRLLSSQIHLISTWMMAWIRNKAKLLCELKKKKVSISLKFTSNHVQSTHMQPI